LRESTLITFFKVCKEYEIIFGVDFKYNGSDHYIDFANGSRIDLLELKSYPTDPTFDRFGSLEYTGGFVEEAGEISFMGYDTIRSRCGRQLNDRYNIIPKVFVTFNPKKNFVDTRFYRPFKAGTLPPEIKFIPALIGDNPHVESQYEAQLKSLSDPAQKQRLLFGNFDFDDDPTALCDYEAITDCFTNDFVKPTGVKYLSADLAMQGRDRFVAGSWDGLVCTVAIDKAKATGKEIEQNLKALMIGDRIPHSKVVADSDGLGA
jgi:phage terminase large subunit